MKNSKDSQTKSNKVKPIYQGWVGKKTDAMLEVEEMSKHPFTLEQAKAQAARRRHRLGLGPVR